MTVSPNDLYALVRQRLDAESQLSTDTGTLLLAALDGEPAIEAALRAEDAAAGTVPADAPPEKHGVYLTGLTVEGFRGIGPRQGLAFTPAVGLTLVVGRNGAAPPAPAAKYLSEQST